VDGLKEKFSNCVIPLEAAGHGSITVNTNMPTHTHTYSSSLFCIS